MAENNKLVQYLDQKNVSQFKHMNIIPDIMELTTPDQVVHLSSNKLIGPYETEQEYLETQFRLLREDFIAPLRRTMCDLLNPQTPDELNEQNVSKYKNVEVSYSTIPNTTYGCITIPAFEPTFQEIFELNSKRFMPGSLVLVSRQGKNKSIVAVGTVINKNFEKKEIHIKFSATNRKQDFYTVFEYKVLFEPYHKVLQLLQKFENVPLKKYIVQMEKRILPSQTKKFFDPRLVDDYSIFGESFSTFSSCYDSDEYDDEMEDRHLPAAINKLNASQRKAHDAAISAEFTLIQGPPGTGKTHTLIQIVRSLLAMESKYSSPILILAYTNHALDQLLERLLPYTKSIVRVGSQSQSRLLVNYNLYVKARRPTRKNRLNRLDDFDVLKDHRIVGMTTTRAAGMECLQNTLTRLRISIVIIEEAAEILEAHVVACLTQHCKQLILIGDHKQLQPITADHRIGTEYGLGVSLFERMINNEMPYYTLNVQHRMRPHISTLLVPTIYESLEDHESVKNRPSIKGITKGLCFVNHYHLENHVRTETSAKPSKTNMFEGEYLVRLANYFMQIGYESRDVAILSTYSAQSQEIQKLSEKFPLLKNVRIDTVDNFQGEEANIVLLSLVRNNSENSIGFLSMENRVCVALSRARNGLFIMGNIFLLSHKSEIWSKIQEKLSEQKAIVPYLKLHCKKHNTSTKIEDISDFEKVSDGGCSRKCDTVMECGHKCFMKCHVTAHKCQQKCSEKYERRGAYCHLFPI